MAILEQKGGTVFTAEALDWEDMESPVLMAIPMSQIQKRADRGLRHILGLLYGNIEPGLIMAKHVYKGLNRAMYVNGNSNADTTKYAYCWTPNADYYLGGNRFSPELVKKNAPVGRVFVAIISPNEDLTNFPDVRGWIEHWSWVDSCPNDATRPIDHENRYEDKVK